jgi:hypothetical protein
LLPPAYTTDKAGKPLLSWRVHVARCDPYAKSLDLSKPWTDPGFSTALVDPRPGARDFFPGELFHCASSGKMADTPLTDYVAVVGPDTLWPGKTPGDLKKHPEAILVVEWPKSDIHWAEPRDISVEEFLDWFRVKPPRSRFWDWLYARPAPGDGFHCGGLLYVDAKGDIGQLPRDTALETVRRLLSGQSKRQGAP